MRSVKRMAKRVCSSTAFQQAFERIGYAIQHVKTKEDLVTLFAVLEGSQPLQSAVTLLPKEKALRNLPEAASNSSWIIAKSWCEWWQRPRHLGEYLLYEVHLHVPTK